MRAPNRPQARPRYPLRAPKPLSLEPWRLNYVREAAKLILAWALTIVAVLLWAVKPGL